MIIQLFCKYIYLFREVLPGPGP